MHCLLVKLIWYLRMVGLQLQGPEGRVRSGSGDGLTCPVEPEAIPEDLLLEKTAWWSLWVKGRDPLCGPSSVGSFQVLPHLFHQYVLGTPC